MITHTKDLMTKKLITLSVDAKVSEAAALMQEKRIRHLPIVDDQDGIVGVLSSKDLPPFPETKNISVEFYMSCPILHVDQDLPLKQAIYKMLENKVSCLIVSNTNENAVGIITTDDLLWYLVTKLDHEPTNKTLSALEKFINTDTAGKVAYQLSMVGI